MKEKILVVDDNKMLCKLLAKKISNSLKLEVEIAFSFEEAKTLIEEEHFFMCFVDLCLPDAPHGEIVDFVLGKSLPSVVLTAMNDEKIRQNFVSKDILDYIFKESDTCIDEIIAVAENLITFQKRKVILAMSKLPERNEVKRNLSLRLFNVLVAAHGEEALNYLEDNVDTGLIICDANMPVVDGIGVLEAVRSKYAKTEIGVILLGEKNDAQESKALRIGANDFIIKPFSKELFNARLNKVLKDMKDLQLISSLTDLDSLSGLKNSNALMSELKDYLREIQDRDEEFALAFLDIDNLGSINEEYGFDVGNELIKTSAKIITNNIKGKDLAGHFDSTKICILLKNISNEKALKIFSLIRVEIKQNSILVALDELFYTASIGVCFGKSKDDINVLMKKADDALKLAKNNGKDRVEVCF
ncbi:diguanylate cyclase response regulator [Campylobacter sp. MIT 99-7217]|uniref:bile resistance response regulator CbrR n=1 Tax=Campylobacter sp. MIT 99-7217 TaxID=535091 RepID=UPI0011599B2A|nr:diguanylate cyclase [Campylobacter sp. MIT 99-7217]TQR31899.1 diguanylate cyclase response regulator [Campylobacter sp. MIT 99-7217]